ncbi:ABC transporter ATP-binding protein [Sphingobacteriales bacterium UPWRP_1]|nr:lipoprotein ABC transporter ATP-binding protein [Sphingobacteriales bacterium TSM_CSS]PSJ77469.1 ABC transporter ATP-binding protein [Sphingobacteriales bacterium UPWRP_1]
MEIISGKKLIKSYGSLQVLKGVDIAVQKAEIVSIVGASGAGKSTLLHIIGTLDRPDSGQLTVGGKEVSRLSERELARFRNKHIGFVFQFHHLLPEFTALENVCIPAYLLGRAETDATRDATELLQFLGLADRLTHKPSQLSGGEQQRVAVARALINRPDVVLADEPSGNLDSDNSRELHRLFFQLRDQFQQTFVIVTHNEELANMSDRKLVIKDGVMLA